MVIAGANKVLSREMSHEERLDHLVYDHCYDPFDAKEMSADDARKTHARDHLRVMSQEEWDDECRRGGVPILPMPDSLEDHDHPHGY